MRKHANTIKEFIKNHKVISGLILLVVLFAGYKIFAGSKSATQALTVAKGDVIQKVIVNGKTKAAESVELGFQTNGTIAKVYTPIGTKVSPGQILVSLDNGEIYAQYLKAQANVASEKARLEEIKKGTRPEEIAVYETTLTNAKASLKTTQDNLKSKIVDAINNKIDQLFSNPNTSNPQFNLTVSDNQLKDSVNNGRIAVEQIINTWSVENIDTNLPKIKTFIDNVALAVNRQSAGGSLTQATLDGYKADLSTAKSTVQTAEQSLVDARSSVSSAEKNLTLKKSGSTPEAISSQEAKVMQAGADLENVSSQLSKTSIKSPQSGVVTKQEAKVGEIVTPGKALVSIISDKDLEIESNVSEISIGKVAVGNPVDIRFDAFPGQIFKGKVTYIEPGETVIDGVVNYKVTVAFDEKYPEIKSGLTSKLDIITGTKTDVVSIPQYAISFKDEKYFVTKKIDEKHSEEVEVVPGLRGQNGVVEITSGLNPGDIIEFLPAK